ncbi:MAG: ABC transporter permease, partial [Chloroflexi bacterium]|nr:ABC transporter permease [Chloroflexota bacterium]
QPLTAGLVLGGMTLAASGFGVLLLSLIRNSRQTGPVLGGVISLSGMLGGLMTTGVSNLPPAFSTINLFFPQGWALRGWKLVLSGSPLPEVLLPVLVLAAMGALCFAAGTLVLRRRFA